MVIRPFRAGNARQGVILNSETSRARSPAYQFFARLPGRVKPAEWPQVLSGGRKLRRESRAGVAAVTYARFIMQSTRPRCRTRREGEACPGHGAGGGGGRREDGAGRRRGELVCVNVVVPRKSFFFFLHTFSCVFPTWRASERTRPPQALRRKRLKPLSLSLGRRVHGNDNRGRASVVLPRTPSRLNNRRRAFDRSSASKRSRFDYRMIPRST